MTGVRFLPNLPGEYGPKDYSNSHIKGLLL